MENLAQVLEVSEEVANALKNNLPVVALESTIITHGINNQPNLKQIPSKEIF